MVCITIIEATILKIYQCIDEEDVVNNRLPRQRRPILLCKVNSRGIYIECNDLVGRVGMSDGGCDETDWAAATDKVTTW